MNYLHVLYLWKISNAVVISLKKLQLFLSRSIIYKIVFKNVSNLWRLKKYDILFIARNVYKLIMFFITSVCNATAFCVGSTFCIFRATRFYCVKFRLLLLLPRSPPGAPKPRPTGAWARSTPTSSWRTQTQCSPSWIPAFAKWSG